MFSSTYHNESNQFEESNMSTGQHHILYSNSRGLVFLPTLCGMLILRRDFNVSSCMRDYEARTTGVHKNRMAGSN